MPCGTVATTFGFGDRPALRLGHRDQRHLGKALVEVPEVRQVLAAMQRRQRAAGLIAENGEMELVDVEVQDVELIGHAAHLVEHHHVMGDGIAHGRVEAQRLGRTGHEPRRGDRIAAGEQRDIVALCDQRVSQVGHDPFGAAIELRRNPFHQRCDLGDLHGSERTVLSGFMRFTRGL
jgi:hypothetical protein